MNMRSQVQRLEQTELHQNLLDEFGSISFAAKKLLGDKNKKCTLYNWLKNGGVPTSKRQNVIDKGFNPDTLKRL